MSDIFGPKEPLGERMYRIRVRHMKGEYEPCWMIDGTNGRTDTIFEARTRAGAESVARGKASEHDDCTYQVMAFITRGAAK